MSFDMVQADVALGRVNASPVTHQEIQRQQAMGPLVSVHTRAILPLYDKWGIFAKKGPTRLDPANE